jgi:hypothetical protein
VALWHSLVNALPWTQAEQLHAFVAVTQKLALLAGVGSPAAMVLLDFKELILQALRHAGGMIPQAPDPNELDRALARARGVVELLKQSSDPQSETPPVPEDGAELPFVSTEDEGILWALARNYPRLLTRAQIPGFSDPPASLRTVSERLPRLLEVGLVAEPQGPKGGCVLAAQGRTLLKRLNPKKLKELENKDPT